MENSEVLNQDTTVIPDGPEQQDVVPVGSDVIENPTNTTTNIYKSAVKTPMSEKDHASTIASNALSNAEAQQTYNYNGSEEKEYKTSVDTSTIQSTGAELNGTFNSEYRMGEGYKATDDADYTWNKLAAEMAQTNYDQEASQARYESIQAKQELDKAATSAFNNYFAAEYSARQTQDKMGWTGGQQQASDLQVEFLKAESAANMYTQAEMQEYGVDTKLGIARMYAEAEQKTLALQYYQDAVDQAVQEANETGWYIPPEAAEMFKQDKVARDVLNNPNATPQERTRAENVLKNTQAYYDSLGFQRGYAYDSNGKVVTEYYGIKTLATLTYEETVRNNKVNEELQRQANDIAQQGVNAAWAGVRVAEKQVEATIAMQDRIAGMQAWNEGQHVTSKHSANYYIGANGQIVDVKPGADMSKINGKYYVMDNAGQVFQVYNSDKAHATQYGNYRAR